MSLSLDRSLLKPVATVVAIVLSLFQIYFTGGFGVTDAHILRGTHLTLIMILVLLLVPSRKLAPGEKEGWFPILIDLALIALAIAINVYVFQEADNLPPPQVCGRRHQSGPVLRDGACPAGA